MISAKQRTALTLGGFTLIGTSLLALTHGLTEQRIRDSQQAAFDQTLRALLPESPGEPQLQTHDHPDGRYWQAVDRDGKLLATLISTESRAGYNGKLVVIGAYNNQGVERVRVSFHQETPGLGDGVEARKSNWIEQFSPQQAPPLALRQNGGGIDALTGATITSQAVIDAVNAGLERYQQIQESEQ